MEISGKCNSNIEFKKRINNFVNNFNSKNEIVIWGTGKSCKILIDTIKKSHYIKYIVDINECLWGNNIFGYEVKSPKELDKEDKLKIKIMIIPYGFVRYDIANHLLKSGFCNASFCFGNDYLVLHNFEYNNRIVIQNLGFFIGSACNLKCKDCIAHLSYYKKNINSFVPFEIIKDDIDNTFKVIDFVNLITLATGEIFMHPEINKIIEYLYKYEQQYNFLQTPINGTIVPRKETLAIMKKCNMGVYISDYSNVIGDKSKIKKIVKLFDEYSIKYELFSDLQGGKAEVPVWSDIGSITKVRARSDDKTAKIYEKCANRAAQVVFKNKLYTCGSAQWSEFGGLYNPDEDKNNDCISIISDFNDKVDLLRVYFGATKKGFPNVCSRCNGIGPYSNPKTVPAGEQL